MSVAEVVSGVIQGVGGVASTLYTNYKNRELQKDINEQQLHFARNAHTIAAADRMRAGLSPLDTVAATTPQLTAAQDENPAQYINNPWLIGKEQDRKQQETDAIVDSSNAKAASDRADVALKTIEAQDKIKTEAERLAALKAEYDNIKDKGSAEAALLKGQLDVQRQELQKMQETINSLRLSNQRDAYNFEWWSSVNMPYGGIPLGNAGNAAMWAGKVSNDKKLEEEFAKGIKSQPQTLEERQREKELHNMYEQYKSDYAARKAELDKMVYSRQISASDARKQLGKMLKYKQWLDMYYNDSNAE